MDCRDERPANQRRLGSRPHSQRHPILRALLVRKVDLGARVLVQPIVSDVTDDPDDGEPRQVHHRNPDAPADGIAERRHELREPLVDDRNRWRHLGIGVGERPSRQKRDLQCAEVIRRDRPVVHIAQNRGLRIDALELDTARLCAAGERQPIDQPR